jgi:hypothetical protein
MPLIPLFRPNALIVTQSLQKFVAAAQTRAFASLNNKV